jgi:hypothetical protein
MNENPFDQSTLSSTSGSTPGSGDAVEVRYPPTHRTLVPALVALSGFLMPAVLFFSLPAPLKFLMAALTAMMEFSAAAFLWFIFNSPFVRADASGITKSQMGKMQSVRWDEIATMETRQLAKGATRIILKNAAGKEVMRASDLNNPYEGALLLTYIETKLQRK